MSEPFVAEVRMFAGNFAPRGWSFCDGQLLPISQNTALFSLLGTTYGGDGTTTVALPNLQGRAPMHPGQGPGLSDRRLGEHGGVERVSLSEEEMPQHSHDLEAINFEGNQSLGADGAFAEHPEGDNLYQSGTPTTEMATGTTQAGGSQSHNNMQPFLSLNFIIALVGLYPSRS